MSTVAVIPAYNEAATIRSVIEGTSKHVDKVVVVDDCSEDDTVGVARDAGATVIEHVFNTGVGGALRTGYRYAIRQQYEVVVQVDADGQHDPSYIPEMLDAIGGCDVVVGSRYLNDSHKDYHVVRRVGIRFFTSLVNVLGGIDITDVTSGFRVYRVEALENILHRSDKHWAVEQTFEALDGGYRLKEISVEMPTRQDGRSQFNPQTLLAYPIRMAEVILRALVFR